MIRLVPIDSTINIILAHMGMEKDTSISNARGDKHTVLVSRCNHLLEKNVA